MKSLKGTNKWYGNVSKHMVVASVCVQFFLGTLVMPQKANAQSLIDLNSPAPLQAPAEGGTNLYADQPNAQAQKNQQGQQLQDFNALAPGYVSQMAFALAQCIPQLSEGQPSFHGCGGWHSAVAATWALYLHSFLRKDATYLPLVESRLTTRRIRQEIDRLTTFPKSDTVEEKGWLLRLYVMDKVATKQERLKPLASMAALQIRRQVLEQINSEAKLGYQDYGLAALYLLEYAQFTGNVSLTSLVKKLLARVKNDCRNDAGVQCQGARARIWTEAAQPSEYDRPFLWNMATSEHITWVNKSSASDSYQDILMLSRDAWLVAFRTDPMTSVYGLSVLLPLLPPE